jgi:ribonucleoside-diphosphate reductase alpha chain
VGKKLQIKRKFNGHKDNPKVVKHEVPSRVEIKNRDGEVIYEQDPVFFPSDWSDRAKTIVSSKYFYGSGEDKENSLNQLVNRVVEKIRKEGWEAGYFYQGGDIDFADELSYILTNQMATFNSPVWFNIGNEEVAQQASACYINSVEDTMESILDLAKTEGMIFKRGSGAGVNLSKLRPEGAPIYGGGTSSGPLSFMKGWDAFAGVIKSGGITRRAAKMIILDADHEDIEDFIWCKVREEKKAHSLIEAGYSPDIDGEAYSSVFYQNANHSVRVPNEFMTNTLDDETTDESKLLSEMAHAAWACGDPGIMYSDTMNLWNTCKASGEIVSTNPCAEYIFLNDTSCNLASINLKKFIAENGEFQWKDFSHVVRVMIIAMDILCGFADYPTKKIKEETLKYRTLGLGYSNVGATLMSLGVPYDSDRARNYMAAITSFMTGVAYLQSAEIAEVRFPFKAYKENSFSMLQVIKQHMSFLDKLEWGKGMCKPVWERAFEKGQQHGFRNAQVTVIAPTGTISFMMDCESTGIEPLISPVATKTLVGGGVMELPHECVEEGLRAIGVKDLDQVPSWLTDVFATAIGDNVISPAGHMEMVGTVQPWLSGGVSKTINLPETATPEDIVEIYKKGWVLGLKNISIYRDNSKGSQPLNVSTGPKSKAIDAQGDTLDSVEQLNTYSDRVRMPQTRKSVTHKFSISGHNGYITVGLYDNGEPGEVFITMAKEGSTLAGLMDSFATTVSLGLQYGIPLEVLVGKLKGAQYEPSGYTGNPAVPHAKSITDYIFKWLEVEFLAGEVVEPQVVHYEVSELGTDSSAPLCSICGGLMAASGPCYTCTSCGDTTGGC